MTRFLRYAMERERKIRALFLMDGAMVQKTVRVLAFDDERVTFLIGAGKKPVVIPRNDLLGCDYARGDHGEE